MVEFVPGVLILLYIFNKERKKLFTQKENLSLVLPALSLPHHIICIPTPSYYLCSLWNSTVTAVCEICSSWIWWLHCSAVLWTEIQLQVRHSLYVVCVPFPVEWHQLQSHLLWNSWSFAGCVLEMFGSFVYTYVHCVHTLIELSWLAGLVQKQLSTCLYWMSLPK